MKIHPVLVSEVKCNQRNNLLKEQQKTKLLAFIYKCIHSLKIGSSN